MSEAVISTRVRFARNLSDYPFPIRMSANQRTEVAEKVTAAVMKTGEYDVTDISKLSQSEAVALVEKHMISPEFVGKTPGRILLLSKDKTVSIMVNEEDHIRLQVILNGAQLDEAYRIADEIDTKLSHELSFAFSDKLGYLTQCPTNLGTGMRASVMLHLPALEKTHAVRRLSSNLSKLGLAIRGIYGEGSEPCGAMYQLSNQVSLGISEQAAIDNLKNIAGQLVTQEMKSRDRIMADIAVQDTIWRSLGVLKTARVIDHSEALKLLSNIRLGVSEKLFDSLSVESIDELVSDIQPANILTRFGDELSPKERDIKRAELIRQKLA